VPAAVVVLERERGGRSRSRGGEGERAGRRSGLRRWRVGEGSRVELLRCRGGAVGYPSSDGRRGRCEEDWGG